MYPLFELHCPDHQKLLVRQGASISKGERFTALVCPSGCHYPVVNGIVRFVDHRNYAHAFGRQWKRFRQVQLDSYTGVNISLERLERCLGGSVSGLQGMKVLEVGCGAGRFTELLLSAGARVFACDLSDAVEANRDNCNRYPNYFVCQADMLNLPVTPSQFDVVIALGMVQHTPNPEDAMSSLCSQVRCGGLLVLDHYTYGYPISSSRKLLRSLLLRVDSSLPLYFCEMLVGLLWPFHRALWKLRRWPLAALIRRHFLRLSPVVDYQDAYRELKQRLLRDWAILDTHDTLTDVYKHLRSKEEIEDHLKRCGMVDVEVYYGGNGVEARARKPMEQNFKS